MKKEQESQDWSQEEKSMISLLPAWDSQALHAQIELAIIQVKWKKTRRQQLCHMQY